MNKVLFFLCFVIIVISTTGVKLHSQTILQNKKPNSRVRFSEYSGQPFYFSDNISAKIYVKRIEDPYEVDEANMNVLSKCVEVYEGDEYVEIDLKTLDSVAFFHEKGEILMYNPPKNTKGVKSLLYKSEQFWLEENLSVRIEEKKYNTPGKTITKKLIRKEQKFQLKVGDETYQVKLSKKELSPILGDEMNKVLKKSKNKLKTRWDFLNLLSLLD